MKDIVIVGAGGFGRETALMIEQMQSWKLRGFYDDGVAQNSPVADKKVLGNIASLNEVKHELAVVISIADPLARQRVSQSLTNRNLNFPILMHPTALASHSTNKFGKGCIITAGVILTTGITLDNFVIINLAATVGHDTHIGSHSSIMPQCSISGNVKIGERCFIGSGSRILQGLTLGNDSTVGSGAVVTKSFEASSKLMGIPAEKR